MADGLKVSGVRRVFGDSVVLEDLSFSVARGEIFALLGPSGSGKSTALNLIAGLDRPDAGEIDIGERRVSDSSVWSRRTGATSEWSSRIRCFGRT